jgi:hypothetical protein
MDRLFASAVLEENEHPLRFEYLHPLSLQTLDFVLETRTNSSSLLA